MARTKPRPGTAPSAAHAADAAAPARDAAAAPDSPAAAVYAALAANPGATVAGIADAAGIGKPAARDALLAMEGAGTATRVKGGRPGIPDTWTLAEPAPDAVGPEDVQAGQPGEDPGVSPDDAGGAETADADEQDRATETGDPAPEDGDDAEAGTSTAPGPQAGQPEPDDETAPDNGEDPDDDDPREDDAAAADGGGGEAGDEPDPALVTDLIERLDQIRAAADASETVLIAGGGLKAVLAGLDEIAEQAAQARRALKAAIGGRKAPAARPGALRDKVLAHLDAHPEGEFTPHEIHKVNGHSSGAIANALETLVKLGQAEVATEKPRKFRRAAQPAEAAPVTAGAGSAEQGSTELAGAA